MVPSIRGNLINDWRDSVTHVSLRLPASQLKTMVLSVHAKKRHTRATGALPWHDEKAEQELEHHRAPNVELTIFWWVKPWSSMWPERCGHYKRNQLSSDKQLILRGVAETMHLDGADRCLLRLQTSSISFGTESSQSIFSSQSHWRRIFITTVTGENHSKTSKTLETRTLFVTLSGDENSEIVKWNLSVKWLLCWYHQHQWDNRKHRMISWLPQQPVDTCGQDPRHFVWQPC